MKTRYILAPLAAAAGVSWWLKKRGGELQNELGAKTETWSWRGFDINVNTAGEGPPIVLLHAFYPGASNAQWMWNFNQLSQDFKVFAPDLLGFGLSARPAMAYDPAIYIDLITDFLVEVVEEPATVVASGHSAAFAIEVAADNPGLISRLALDTPVGLRRFSDPPTFEQRLSYQLMRLPVIGAWTYLAMTSKRQIRRQLRANALADPSLATANMVLSLYKQSHQPGAKWATIALMGGRLNRNVAQSYMELRQPVLLLWGDMPSYIPVGDADAFVDLKAGAELRTFANCRLMPEYEHPSKFNNVLIEWMQSARKAA